MKRIFLQIKQGSSSDVGILFLRIFIGAVMLLHIVGKLQNFSNLSLHFQSLLGFSGVTSLSASVIVEGLFAAMIITGVGVRLASILMTIVSAVAFVELALASQITSDVAKLEFIYMGIYLTLAISGGGKYAAGSMLEQRKMS
jgi:uncharacterized membrane protein YphA (DoxX/SURF4 family)